MGRSSSSATMINLVSGLDSEHTVSHFKKGLWVMWPTIEICANAGDSQRRKNIFLWPMISISMDSQGGHLGENPFHFRKLCSTFLRVERKHGDVYEAALVSLVCSQNWEVHLECSGPANVSRYIIMTVWKLLNAEMVLMMCGWCSLRWFFHQRKQIWGWSLPSSSLCVMGNLVEVDLDYGTRQTN